MAGPIVYDSTKFDVAAGKYTGRLVAVVDKEPYQGESKYGKPSTEPRLGWRFEVIGPPGSPALGKTIEQGTGTTPSKKSGLVRLLALLLGRMPHEGERIDPAAFIGKDYSIKWAVNPRSDAGNCYIADLEPLTPPNPGDRSTTLMHGSPVPGQHEPANPGQRTPIPTPPPPPPPKRSVAPVYWVRMPDGSAPEMSQATLQAHLDSGNRPAEEVMVMDQANIAGGWKTAAELGFKLDIPF